VTKKGRNMLTGMRRVQSKIIDGKRVRKVFQELGANLEWQAPEVIQQVRPFIQSFLMSEQCV
jgi:hypothetical protein